MAKRWSGYLILGMWLLNLLHLYLGFSPWPAAIAASAGTVICGIGMMIFAEFGKISDILEMTAESTQFRRLRRYRRVEEKIPTYDIRP